MEKEDVWLIVWGLCRAGFRYGLRVRLQEQKVQNDFNEIIYAYAARGDYRWKR